MGPPALPKLLEIARSNVVMLSITVTSLSQLSMTLSLSLSLPCHLSSKYGGVVWHWGGDTSSPSRKPLHRIALLPPRSVPSLSLTYASQSPHQSSCDHPLCHLSCTGKVSGPFWQTCKASGHCYQQLQSAQVWCNFCITRIGPIAADHKICCCRPLIGLGQKFAE